MDIDTKAARTLFNSPMCRACSATRCAVSWIFPGCTMRAPYSAGPDLIERPPRPSCYGTDLYGLETCIDKNTKISRCTNLSMVPRHTGISVGDEGIPGR